MGRVEKKFQKRKERERAVRKKILKRRETASVMTKRIEAQDKLEREVNKIERKNKPICNVSPELKKALESVEKLTENAFVKEKPGSYGTLGSTFASDCK